VRVEDYMSKATPQLPAIAFEETAEPMTRANIRQRRGTPVTARPDAEPVEPRMTRIARRAHELYETRGAQDGRDLDDWLQAEREIDAEIDREHDARG
jgi:hypothetical protein